MILGRYFGTLIAVYFILLFKTNTAFDYIAAIFIAGIGLLAGMLISTYLGINFKTDQPTEKDGLKFWTDKYGEEFGKEAYKYWLEELGRHD